MKIDKNIVVTLQYTLKGGSADAKIIENTSPSEPLVFLFGAGNMLPSFEEHLKGLEENSEFAFGIPSDQAYGDIDEAAIIDLEKDIFKGSEDLLAVDNILPLQDQNGNPLNGRVLEISDTSVKVDLNHPMAGKDLYFEGVISSLRLASAEEVSHGHAHGPGGHQH